MESSEFELTSSEEEMLSRSIGKEVRLQILEKLQIKWEDKPIDFDEWAPCKQQAWLSLKDNPNAFFYRHVMPGTKQKNGPWSLEEKELFLKAIKEDPPDSSHWGLFSIHIPGRVGYQCNAFYKKLIASGEIKASSPSDEDTICNQLPKKKPHRRILHRLGKHSGRNYAFMFPVESINRSFFIPNENNDNNRISIAKKLSNPSAFNAFDQFAKPLFIR